MAALTPAGNFVIRCRYHEKEIIHLPESINGHSFTIEDVQDCEISLLDYTDSLQITACEDATIRCGPTKGVCRVEKCKGCMISVACSHVVIQDCQDLLIFLLTASEPELFHSSQVTFAPYNLAYPFLKSHFIKASLDPGTNLWSRVRTTLEYGPNWNLLPFNQFFLDRKDLQGLPSPDDPGSLSRPEEYQGQVKGDILTGSQGKLQGNPEEPAILTEEINAFSEGYTPNGATPITKFPADSQTLVFVYNDQYGFCHSLDSPSISFPICLKAILTDLTKQAKPAYAYFNMLKISTFALILAVLWLYLIVILLSDFIAMHPGALAFNLFILTFSLFVLLLLLFLRYKSRIRESSADLQAFLASKQGDLRGSGLEIEGDVSQVTIKVLTS